MASSVTQVVTARVPNRHAETLRRIADREGETISGLICRLIDSGVHRLDRAA